jgi:hypothetical protein
VAERVIQTLNHGWLRRVPVICDLDHLELLLPQLLRPHMTVNGAVPESIRPGRNG